MLNTTLTKLSLVLLASLLTQGCDKDVAPLYGRPTIIETTESPVDVICRIQEEFKALPKPLMLELNYQSSWTTYNFPNGAVDHTGYYRVLLRPEALTFLEQHSRIELVASLLPLFIDPSIGGEAAVLLAGILRGTEVYNVGKPQISQLESMNRDTNPLNIKVAGTEKILCLETTMVRQICMA